ncbi:MAG TPA: metalloregulator ArsR/SmtB family transcription factor [Candidatus Cybelea sp.]|jgi:DNA-binding transcriptional ArsR family regulator|nr:metalloregulator ArsR/SmtB family transcription factor [Candidatus Cybelea sp.]
MDAFSALADPTRRRIVEILARGALPAGRIAGAFDSARPTISRHLRVLREAGLVRVSAVAQERRYELQGPELAKAEGWLARHRRFWEQHLNALQRHLENEHE